MVYGGAVLILFVFLILLTVKDFSLSSKYVIIPEFTYIIIYFLLLNFLIYILKKTYKSDLILVNNNNINNNNIAFLNTSLDNYIYVLKYKANDIFAISDLLYTKYFFFLLSVIFILFFSIISSIFLIKSFFNK